MAIASSSSNFFSLSPLYQNSKPHFPSSLITHFLYPLNWPSISLKTPKNPISRNGLFITSMGTYNVQVIVEENEPEDRLLNRFRREVSKAGVIQECKRRRWFENAHDKKKRKSREAARRNRKSMRFNGVW
ncbi:30S ribosomal protein S21 chloroplastic [Bienertia sinuspersici]